MPSFRNRQRALTCVAAVERANQSPRTVLMNHRALSRKEAVELFVTAEGIDLPGLVSRQGPQSKLALRSRPIYAGAARGRAASRHAHADVVLAAELTPARAVY